MPKGTGRSPSVYRMWCGVCVSACNWTVLPFFKNNSSYNSNEKRRKGTLILVLCSRADKPSGSPGPTSACWFWTKTEWTARGSSPPCPRTNSSPISMTSCWTRRNETGWKYTETSASNPDRAVPLVVMRINWSKLADWDQRRRKENVIKLHDIMWF